MQLIRNNCFETNSSSCHSISLARNSVNFDTILPNSEDGRAIEIDLSAYEFGWEEEQYVDPMTKLAYVLLDIDYIDRPDSPKSVLVRDAVESHTGCKLVVVHAINDGWSGGYIDHQSRGTCDSSGVLDSQETIKQFIFSTRSVLTTDNDNH